MAATLLLGSGLVRADDVQESVRAIALRCRQIDDQLERSLHYRREIPDAGFGANETQEAWISEARDPLKVIVERRESKRTHRSEIYLDDGEIFVLDRVETPQENGDIQVDEWRKYLEGGKVIRELTKSGRFHAGESLDTVHLKNTVLDPTQYDRSLQPATNTYDLDSLTTDDPVHDPAAGSPGDSAKYRIIRRSASPDGRYALGWAPKTGKIDWDKYGHLGDYGGSGDTDQSPAHTYVVDLSTHRILGETGADYSGTRARYNHRENKVAWSSNGRYFIQTTSWKWYSDYCRAGYIDAKGRFIGPADVLSAATKEAKSFLREKHDAAFRSHPFSEFALSIGATSIDDSGNVELIFDGEIPKSMEDNSGFELALQLHLEPSGRGLIIGQISARYAPKETNQ